MSAFRNSVTVGPKTFVLETKGVGAVVLTYVNKAEKGKSDLVASQDFDSVRAAKAEREFLANNARHGG